MNPTAIYSKSGKGVQEASGKTSLLPRPDRAVLSAIDGRATLADVAQKVGRPFDAALQALIAKLDKDGFIREVSAGVAPPAPPAPPAAKPAAKPAGKAAPAGDFGDLDFSSLGGGAKAPSPPPRPASPPPPSGQPPKAQHDALAKAREEAEARAAADRERMRAEAEARTRAEMEAKLRAEAEKKLKEEAEAKAKADAEAKVKAAREAALKAAAEAKARAEAEAQAKVEAERKARMEEEAKRQETERRLEAERKAREEAERKAREEAERVRREAEEKARREAEELRQRLEAERKAREEAERKAKEEAERVRRELEEERKRLEAERKREEEERAARRKREEEEAAARRRQKEEEERKAEEERAARRRQQEEEERKAEEKRAAKRRQREEEEAREREEEQRRAAEREAKRKQREAEEAEQAAAAAQAAAAKPKAEEKAPAKKDDFADSLLSDLESFTNREDEEAKAREEAERKAKAEAERRAREEAQREAERREQEEAESRRREEEERRRREEEARRAREEEERRAQEEERRKREAEEIRRKAEAATAAAMAKEGRSADDIPVGDEDLDMDEVQREQAVLDKGKPKERAPEKKREKEKASAAEALPRVRRPGKGGKPIVLALVVLAVAGVGLAHVVPLGTGDYERAATEALGRPVKIGSARLWLFTGVQVRMKDVSVGDAKIANVAAAASIGSLFGEKKEFGRVELDGLTLPQSALSDAIFANVRGDNLRVERIVVKSLDLPGPAALPKGLLADVALDAKGAMKSATVRGPDGLVAKLVPKDAGIEVDLVAAGFTLPIAPQVTLSNFILKGVATPRGMTVSDWGGSIFNGAISGTASIRWGSSWTVDGVFTVRNINAAVFAPALLSAGTGEGTAKFSMNAPDPSGLVAASRIDGNFTISKGTLGSFDLARAIQTEGKQAGGTTAFAEMSGQGTYDRGAVALRNVTIGAGALNAGASADIARSGALSGRIVADVRNASRTLSATLHLGGTVKDPQVRN